MFMIRQLVFGVSYLYLWLVSYDLKVPIANMWTKNKKGTRAEPCATPSRYTKYAKDGEPKFLNLMKTTDRDG